MQAYVCSIAQPNTDGDAQIYVSNAAFRFRRAGADRHDGDLVHRFLARPLTIFSHPLDGLDAVTLETFLIRDRRHARDVASVLDDILDGDGSIASQLAEGIAAVTNPTVGAVFGVAKAVARGIAAILRHQRNRLIVYDVGTQPVEPLGDHREESWGEGTGDKGFFRLHFDKVRVANPRAVKPPTLPASIQALLDPGSRG